MKIYVVAAFLILVAGILYGMNLYVLTRILGFFSISHNIWIYSLVLALMFPLSTVFDKLFHSKPSIIIYYAFSLLLGIIFISLFILLAGELVNLIYPIFKNIIAGAVIISIILLLTAISLYNANHLIVKEVKIKDFGADLKIVQLSDVHIGTIRNQDFLKRVVNKTNELKPDIVVITGDLLDGSGKLNLSVLEPLNDIDAPIFFVMGNHEFYEGEDKVIKMLNKTKVKVLRNSSADIQGIQIIGLDYSDSRYHVAEYLEKIKVSGTKPSILLNHVPVGYRDAQKKGIKLQLSGHTHGGQIFPFTFAVKIAFPHDKGLWRFGNFFLYVSEGTGTWGPPLKLGSKSEITLLKLSK